MTVFEQAGGNSSKSEDILLISMPFCPVEWPSPGIGVLVSAAKQAGLNIRSRYLNLVFAKKLGLEFYQVISGLPKAELLFGEWIFSHSAFSGLPEWSPEAYPIRRLKEAPVIQFSARNLSNIDEKSFWQAFDALPELAAEFIESQAQEILSESPAVVGCSTNFQQYTSSLALLRALKRERPEIVTLMGGANCEGEMGLITKYKFPWVDYVVSGEADTTFPRLCRLINEYGNSIPKNLLPPGVFAQSNLPLETIRAQQPLRPLAEVTIVNNMSEVPDPDMEDYFTMWRELELEQTITPYLIMESSRGCWKAQAKTCNFCGLNGRRSRFRQKSSTQVVDSYKNLAERYGITQFKTTDCIISPRAFKGFLQDLSEQGAPYNIGYETSSNLKEEQVKALAAGGVTWFQPGIESLQPDLIELMNKGNSGIHNIALLKFAKENGLEIYWNILFGIPGDRPEYYQEMVDFLPLLYHLPPPNLIKIRFDRFSPYHDNPSQYGLKLEPCSEYRAIYPFNDYELEQFASFFSNSGAGVCDENCQEILQLHTAVYNHWRPNYFRADSDLQQRPELIFFEEKEHTIIKDTRPVSKQQYWHLEGLYHSIYQKLRSPITEQKLFQLCGKEYTAGLELDIFLQHLECLLAGRLIFRQGELLLALATSLSPEASKTNINIQDQMTHITQKPEGKSQVNNTWDWINSL